MLKQTSSALGKLAVKLVISCLAISFIACNSFAESKIEKLLQRDFSRMMKPIPVGSKFYHYFNLNQNSSSFISASERQLVAKNKINSAEVSFWTNSYNDTSGPGLYTGLDPVVSEEFGNTALIVNVKTKFNYVGDTEKFKLLSQESKDELAQIIITDQPIEYVTRSATPFFRIIAEPKNQKVKTLLKNIFKKLNIEAALVEYPSGNKFCFERRQKGSMLFFGNESNLELLFANENLKNLTKAEASAKAKFDRYKELVNKFEYPYGKDNAYDVSKQSNKVEILKSVMLQMNMVQPELDSIKTSILDCK